MNEMKLAASVSIKDFQAQIDKLQSGQEVIDKAIASQSKHPYDFINDTLKDFKLVIQPAIDELNVQLNNLTTTFQAAQKYFGSKYPESTEMAKVFQLFYENIEKTKIKIAEDLEKEKRKKRSQANLLKSASQLSKNFPPKSNELVKEQSQINVHESY